MARSSLILGATGAVGRHCLGFLLASARYSRVTALTRRRIEFEHRKLEQHVVDFRDFDAAMAEADDVFCCLGTTIAAAGSEAAFKAVDFEIPLRVAEAAKAQGARRFLLVSSVGADAGASNFYLRTKGELEMALDGAGFEELSIFRPSLLLGEREEFRLGEMLAKPVAPLLSLFLFGSLNRYKPIDARDVARAMVALEPEPGSRVLHHDEMLELQ